MPTMNDPILEKKVYNNQAYYTVNWSPLIKADTWEVSRKIPSMAGIYELFYMDEYNKLVLLDIDKVWYGGLRNRLRESIDPELEIKDMERKKILEDHELHCRYCLSNSIPDMSDVLYVYIESCYPEWEEEEPSGRYKKVFINENSPNKIITT